MDFTSANEAHEAARSAAVSSGRDHVVVSSGGLWTVLSTRTAYDLLGHGAVVDGYYEIAPPGSAEPVRVLRSEGTRRVILMGTNWPQFIVKDSIAGVITESITVDVRSANLRENSAWDALLTP